MPGAGLRESSAQLVLFQGMLLLHPEDAAFEAMLKGWGWLQRREAPGLQPDTISDRQGVVRRFAEYANAYL